MSLHEVQCHLEVDSFINFHYLVISLFTNNIINFIELWYHNSIIMLNSLLKVKFNVKLANSKIILLRHKIINWFHLIFPMHFVEGNLNRIGIKYHYHLRCLQWLVYDFFSFFNDHCFRLHLTLVLGVHINVHFNTNIILLQNLIFFSSLMNFNDF